MLSTKRMFWFVIIGVFLLAGCQTVPSSESEKKTPYPALPSLAELAKVPRVTPMEVKGLQDAGVKLTIVDTRTREEYDEEHIQGALFLADLEARSNEFQKSAKLVFY